MASGGGSYFVGFGDSGHGVVMDSSKEEGGTDLGPRPIELFLMAAAGCTAFDVAQILSKSGAEFDEIRVIADAERAPDHPRIFVSVRFHYVIVGDVDPSLVERAISLSQRRYCSASAMIRRSGAEIYTSFELIGRK